MPLLRENPEPLWALVRSIPRGRVASYGSLGAALEHPASGYIVGRFMANCPDGVPWWRVVAKDGRLPVAKSDPAAEQKQVLKLSEEGVEIVDGVVDMKRFSIEIGDVT